MLGFAPHRRRRNGVAVAAAFGVLLVLLPGICSATVAALAPHGDTSSRIDPPATPRPFEDAGGEHAHHGPHPAAPASDDVPATGDDHCVPHECCVKVVKNAAREAEIGSPIAIDTTEVAAAAELARGDGQAAVVHDLSAGPPGLTTTNRPLRR